MGKFRNEITSHLQTAHQKQSLHSPLKILVIFPLFQLFQFLESMKNVHMLDEVPGDQQ